LTCQTQSRIARIQQKSGSKAREEKKIGKRIDARVTERTGKKIGVGAPVRVEESKAMEQTGA
jgi:hypothetical protein